MDQTTRIINENPARDGRAAGHKLGAMTVEEQTRQALSSPVLSSTLGGMSRQALEQQVMSRLKTPPQYDQYPELQDIYPDRVDYLAGFAKGADCSVAQAAVWDYVHYRQEIDGWWQSLNPGFNGLGCSGVLLVGPDGVLGSQSAESLPPQPRPDDYRHRKPRPYVTPRQGKLKVSRRAIRRPRTGYIECFGATNECGVACVASNSCSTWLDEPIEDVWPIKHVPLLRFARTADELAALYQRYTLFNWGRFSQIWADVAGRAVVIEKSFRRVGVRRLENASAIWCTEGHFQTEEMSSFIRAKRLEYVRLKGDHLGADDLQYAHDCAVRFTHIGELCHQPWGHGLEHMRRILCDHAPFPRAVCRHGGPDTAVYDKSVTMGNRITDLTHNRTHDRNWSPWRRFPCQATELVTQHPPRPCDR